MFCVKLFEPFACDVRINLCRRNIGMSEQQLHHAQIGTMIEQMGGKSMAQRVR